MRASRACNATSLALSSGERGEDCVPTVGESCALMVYLISGRAAPKQGLRLHGVGLISLGQFVKSLEGCVQVFAVAQREAVDAAAVHAEQEVVAHFADGTQFTLVAVAFAQQARGGIAAAVHELGEIDRDDLQLVHVP